MGGQDHTGAAVHPGQLLHRNGVADGIQPRSPVLLGVGNAHQAQLAQLADGLIGKLIGLVQRKGNGLDLLLGKGPDLGAQLLLRLGGLKQHGAFSSF